MRFHTDQNYDRDSVLYRWAVKTKLYRPFKILRGLLRMQSSAARGGPFDRAAWWDEYYRDQALTDQTTIGPGQSLLPTLYHYNSVENVILAYLFNNGVEVVGRSVLDIGSGAGHWLEFYRLLGAERVVGVELSSVAARGLEKRFESVPNIAIRNSDAAALDFDCDFDIVNAIGVMFHIVDDTSFASAVRKLKAALKPGGLLIVGGAFGLLGNIDVQFDSEGRPNKRLRSRRYWRQLLAGFSDVRVYRNLAYRNINAPLPENDLLIARR
jgi:SAM-dependent methyltransferase